jgi:sec-independent protein translocase protein TatC
MANAPKPDKKTRSGFLTPGENDSPVMDTFAKVITNPADLLPHLNELRQRVTRSLLVFVVCAAIALFFSSTILAFLTRPLGGLSGMVAIEVTEPLSTVMRVTLLSGFILALPYIAYEFYMFIAPAIISPKRRLLGLSAIPLVFLLFLTGAAFAYFVFIPNALDFLLNLMGIQTQVRPASYISFVTGVMFWIGLSFEFPLVIFVLASIGWVKSETLIKHWRIAVVIIAIVAAAITPTIDPINMGIIMLPLVILYFFGAFLAKIAQRGRSQRKQAEQAESNV